MFTYNRDDISSRDETRPRMKTFLFTSDFHLRIKQAEFHTWMKFMKFVKFIYLFVKFGKHTWIQCQNMLILKFHLGMKHLRVFFSFFRLGMKYLHVFFFFFCISGWSIYTSFFLFFISGWSIHTLFFLFSSLDEVFTRLFFFFSSWDEVSRDNMWRTAISEKNEKPLLWSITLNQCEEQLFQKTWKTFVVEHHT